MFNWVLTLLFLKMVRVGGLEPPRYRYQRIFILLYVTIAVLLRCSLEHVFTLSFDLGSWCMLSTLEFFTLARRSASAFAVLANFYSKSFLLGTLWISPVYLIDRTSIKVRCVCLFRHTRI